MSAPLEIDGTAGAAVHYGVYVLYNADEVTVTKNTIHDVTNERANLVSDVAGVGILFLGWGQGIEGATIDRNAVYNTGRHGIFMGGVDSADYWLLSPASSEKPGIQRVAGTDEMTGGGIQITEIGTVLLATTTCTIRTADRGHVLSGHLSGRHRGRHRLGEQSASEPVWPGHLG
jgi:hypothetical protein